MNKLENIKESKRMSEIEIEIVLLIQFFNKEERNQQFKNKVKIHNQLH